MCTVTFIPYNDTVFITHNRDEQSSRTKAIAPKEYTVNGYTLLFPRDTAAGGSWIAINKNGAAAVLLNGAFIKHAHQPPYRKSRGLAFLEIVASGDLIVTYYGLDLDGIEPFTVILWSNHSLYECRWDGSQKHMIELDATTPHTWSSVTLYDEAIMTKRKAWFDSWLQKNPNPSQEQIVQYHLTTGDGDATNDLRMNREGKLLTVSITSIAIGENRSTMQYIDLQDNNIEARTSIDFFTTKANSVFTK